MIIHYLSILLIGMIVGFLGGLFGKGGSAIATPMLSLIGIPGFNAVASPLPATVPGTFVASFAYWRSNLVDRKIVLWSILFGVPATIIGSYITEFTGVVLLLVITGLLVLFFSLSFLLFPKEKKENAGETEADNYEQPSWFHLRLFFISVFIGFISGLLANSGGFLLAPSYARILKLPIKKSFACSLAVSMMLALPGTIIHAYLGHIDWLLTIVLSFGSVPFSLLGARLAIKSNAGILERFYGFALTVLGVLFLWKLF